MDPVNIPDDLSELTFEQLTELASQARAYAEHLFAEDAVAHAAEIEALAADFERLNETAAALAGEDEAALATETEAADRAAAALARFGTADAQVETLEVEGEELPDPDEEVEPDLTPNTEPDPEEVPVTEPAAVAASARSAAPTRKPSATALARTRGTTTVRPTEDAAPEGPVPAPFFATAQARGATPGQELSKKELAKAVCEVRNRFGNNIPEGTFDPITIASAGVTYPEELQMGGLDPVRNFTVLQNAIAMRRDSALVASGGVLGPLTPRFGFFKVAEPQSPVENALPTVAAPQGGIEFLNPTDFNAAAGGIGVTTEAQDRAGYVSGSPAGPTAEKPFITFGPVTTSKVYVTAVSQGVRFGNLAVRTWPEYVESRLDDLAILFARTKEVLYLDRIAAGSKTVTKTVPYGASRGIVHALIQGRAGYVKRANMDYNARVDLYLPDWTRDLMLIDLFNDHAQGVDQLMQAANRGRLDTLFRALGFNVTFYYDSETAEAQAFREVQNNAAPLNDFPAQVVAYYHTPGTFIRLDGGTLEVGVYRDSALNRTNDLEMFSEQWLEVAKVGLEAIKLEINCEPSGAAPEPAPLAVNP